MSPLAQMIIRSCDRRVLELERIQAWLSGNGFQLSSDHRTVDRRADIIFLTTCGVTQMHEDFTFDLLARIQAGKKPGARVVMGGCVPEINPERVARDFGGPTFSPKAYHKLDEILPLLRPLAEFARPNLYTMYASYRTDVGNIVGLAQSLRWRWFDLLRQLWQKAQSRLRRRATYLVQLHEGCSMGCSYCAIQKAIGPLRNSLPVEEAVTQIQTGLVQGYHRIRLIGDSAGSYGLERGTNLGALLRQVAEIKGSFQLELTDIHPAFLKLIFEPVKTLCAQKRPASLYTPLQSGSERVLKLMRRRCDVAQMQQMLGELRAAAPPGFKLGTSVIVGFPSETPEDLQQTLDVCNQVGFDWIWCHGFSPRPGTLAAELPDQLAPEEVTERVQRFRAGIYNSQAVILDFQ